MKQLDVLIKKGDELVFQMLPKMVAEQFREGTTAKADSDSSHVSRTS